MPPTVTRTASHGGGRLGPGPGPGPGAILSYNKYREYPADSKFQVCSAPTGGAPGRLGLVTRSLPA
jgi:hypothetical protein